MAKITKKKFFEVKTFGLVISFFVFIATLLLFSTDIYNKLNLKILDLNFYLKQGTARKTVQDGAERVEKNPELSDDIVIIGIDSNSLDKLGRWPFPRSVHGDFLTSLDRIKKQNQRENAVFLDIFFMEPDNMAPDNDMVLLNGFVENGNVFIETILTED
ncbi:MAG: CHASE2 domain-containing protein, partial [Spirochaetia bacterium]|nr:CHASE2 domain-containing protein [Spirochaetia bacterium]